MSPVTQEQFLKKLAVGNMFTPGTPINEQDLFCGRANQIQSIIDTVSQRGLHAIIYGEMGVGKTSLSNILAAFFKNVPGAQFQTPRVTCHTADDFSALWARVFNEVKVPHQATSMGLNPKTETETVPLRDIFPGEITPDVVREALELATQRTPFTIIIIDEFDRLRLTSERDSMLFADTIKVLSDRAVRATLVLVGVADTVEDLIHGHESVQRNLVQIHLPRMSKDEIKKIVTDRLPRLGMTIETNALEKVCALARGFPHYAHLIGQHAAWKAVESDQTLITEYHVGTAMRSAVDNSRENLQKAYHAATMSPRDNLFEQALLAAALAKCDDFGFFSAADVRDPMSKIMQKRVEIPRFSKHLAAFCTTGRGPVLQEIGDKYQRRFRFKNPLMQPYVIIRGVADGLITISQLDDFSGDIKPST